MTQPPGAAGPTTPANPDEDDELEDLTWEEKVHVATHKAAMESALESSDGACGTIMTACFSLATAYGAVIALVAAKDTQPPLLVVSPFVLLAAGAVVALVGKAAGISLGKFDTTQKVKELVRSAIVRKRRASWWAVGLAALGVVLAGYVVFVTYGRTEQATSERSEIVFSTLGKAQFAEACGGAADVVVGSARFAGRWVTITLTDDAAADCAGTRSLTLPATAIAYILAAP